LGNVEEKVLTWTSEQRTAFKERSLSHERVTRLQSIGLDFGYDPNSSRRNATFEKMYQELVEYHAEHGNCYVSRQTNLPLAHWLANVRAAVAGTNKHIPSSRVTSDQVTKVSSDF